MNINYFSRGTNGPPYILEFIILLMILLADRRFWLRQNHDFGVYKLGTAQFAENRFAENEISVNRVDMPKSFFQMEIRFAEKQSVDSFTQIYNREWNMSPLYH